jgi:hypothetical protein
MSDDAQFISDEAAAEQRRPLNRYAIGSLIAGACLIAPVGAILGIIAVRQIRASGGKQQGMLLAGIGLVMSFVVVPVALVLLLTADPAVFNSCRVLQHQAEGTLRVMRFLEEEYKEKHGRYGTTEEIDFKSMYGDRPYLYEIVEVSDDMFVARATGRDEMLGDIMEVKAGGKLQKVHDVCRGDDRPRP